MTIHIVTGPPAAGKSTYIHQHRKPGDITIDYDELANTLAGLKPANHQHQTHIKIITKAARQAAINKAIDKHDGTHNVWIIHSNPSANLLTKYKAAGANIITIDPGKDTVMKRCKQERPKHMLKVAAQYYEKQKQQKQQTQQTTTKRGDGWNQQRERDRLIRIHKDGTPCWWCGQPMYRNKNKNHDHLPLAADHTEPNGAREGKKPTRLLHFTCNSSRKDGKNDHKRPALTTTPQPPKQKPFQW